MINILFLAFEFPPLNRGGVHRALSFVKWLPKFGINPVVVTLDEACYPNVFNEYGLDKLLGLEVRKDADLIAIKSKLPSKENRVQEFASIFFSLYGNETRFWKDNFLERLPDIMEMYRPAAVLATAPPFSILPLALQVKRTYRLPLIIDFRDAWSQWRTIPFGTRLHYWANLFVERKYLKEADAILCTSLETLNDFERLHPHVSHSKFHYVPNGYEGRLSEWTPLNIAQRGFTIGYVGSFYYSPEARKQMLAPWWKKRGHRILQYIPQKQDWLYRSPFFFFKVLQHLKSIDPSLSMRIKVKFVGKTPSWLTAMVSDLGLIGQIEFLGEMTHDEAIVFQRSCDLLLITSAKRIGGKDYSVAGKTFEYIQAQKPILAFVCDGAQKSLLENTGMALICDPDMEQESAEQISALLRGEKVLQPNSDFVNALSRERVTVVLADIIRKVVQT